MIKLTAAKEASRQPFSDSTITTPYQDIVKHITQKIKNNWKMKWLNNPNTKLHEIRQKNVKATQ